MCLISVISKPSALPGLTVIYFPETIEARFLILVKIMFQTSNRAKTRVDIKKKLPKNYVEHFGKV